ncbi:hypothetical protein [Microbacterium cremeum]|uniref:hypothetical protein n=1 Tax=Microbacterium cremeum TaxID=2782169 RepID=UPI0018889BA2|nr:hypothetical protein [Microbacterium cremeum]
MAERRPRRTTWAGARRASALAVLSSALVLSVAAGTPALAAEDDEPTGGSGGISVDVTDGGPPFPVPTPTRTGPGGPGGNAGNPGSPGNPGNSGNPGNPGNGGNSGNAGNPGDGGNPGNTSLPGARVLVAIGGLGASVSPSFQPGGGVTTLSVIVRNTSDEAFDATATFRVANLLGLTIAEVGDVPIAQLEPNEARRVSTTVEGLGQAILLRGYVTVTPPPVVAEQKVAPATRESVFFVPPLFLASTLGAAGVVAAGLWWTLGAGRYRAVLAVLPFARAGA